MPDPLSGAWTDLTDLRHWRALDGGEPPARWQVEEDALHFTPGQGGGGDLISREAYGDFELTLDWKIAPCGNSGIFYRGAGGPEPMYLTAPEMQVLDDACHEDARFPSHVAGSLYDLAAPTVNAVRPAGAWNAVRIVARGAHLEHWVNGQQVGAYEQGGPSWNARVAVSKFREMPAYGTRRSGFLGLQDHGDEVWYRHVRIRRLAR